MLGWSCLQRLGPHEHLSGRAAHDRCVEANAKCESVKPLPGQTSIPVRPRPFQVWPTIGPKLARNRHEVVDLYKWPNSGLPCLAVRSSSTLCAFRRSGLALCTRRSARDSKMCREADPGFLQDVVRAPPELLGTRKIFIPAKTRCGRQSMAMSGDRAMSDFDQGRWLWPAGVTPTGSSHESGRRRPSLGEVPATDPRTGSGSPGARQPEHRSKSRISRAPFVPMGRTSALSPPSQHPSRCVCVCM